jgi:uncharacterized protein YgiM (DUF1202 family)
MVSKKTERTVVLDDAKLFQLVTKKGEMVDKGRKLSAEMERLAKEHEKVHKEQNDLITEVNKVKLQIIDRVKKVGGSHLGEFEVPVTTDIKDGKVIFTIADSMAEFVATFKKFDKWASVPKPK